MSKSYAFTVAGRAVPQGSKRAFVNKSTGRAMMLESSSRHKHWRQLVALCAQESKRRPDVPLDEPVIVAVTFSFARPKSHYVIRKTGNLLKMDAPLWATSRAIGDIDKLLRSVLDAITDAGWIRDDSLIARVFADKTYTTGRDQISVCVTPLENTVKQHVASY